MLFADTETSSRQRFSSCCSVRHIHTLLNVIIRTPLLGFVSVYLHNASFTAESCDQSDATWVPLSPEHIPVCVHGLDGRDAACVSVWSKDVDRTVSRKCDSEAFLMFESFFLFSTSNSLQGPFKVHMVTRVWDYRAFLLIDSDFRLAVCLCCHLTGCKRWTDGLFVRVRHWQQLRMTGGCSSGSRRS